MDRSIWLSLLALGIRVTLTRGARAISDGAGYLQVATLAAEIEALAGAPSDRTS